MALVEPTTQRLLGVRTNAWTPGNVPAYGYVYLSPDVIGDMPPGVVTVTSTTVPLDLAGTFAVMEVSLLTVNDVAGVDPK